MRNLHHPDFSDVPPMGDAQLNLLCTALSVSDLPVQADLVRQLLSRLQRHERRLREVEDTQRTTVHSAF